MSAQTSAPRPFVDGIEKAAYQAGHVSPIMANLGTPPAMPTPAQTDAELISHLYDVAEHQADQRRVDALRITELERRAEHAEKVARAAMADYSETLRQAENKDAAYAEVRHALAEAEDQRDNYRRQLGAALAKIQELRAGIGALASADERAGRRWLGQG